MNQKTTFLISCFVEEFQRLVKVIVVFGIIALGFVSVQAAIISTAANNQEIHLTTAWTGGVVPTTGDTGVVNNSNSRVTSTATFLADLEIVSGGSLTVSGASLSTAGDLTLDGGLISLRSGRTLDLGNNDFILNSGQIELRNRFDLNIQNAFLVGSGSIDLVEADTNNRALIFANTVDTSGFTGTFNLLGGNLELPDITLADASFGLDISGSGIYNNTSDIALTSLTIDGTMIAPGTFVRSDFTAAQQAFIGGDDTFTITVVAIPEPAAVGILGLGSLFMLLIRRKRII